MSELDRLAAGAEAKLDRLDGDRIEDDREATPDAGPGSVGADDFGFHLDDPAGDLYEDDLEVGIRDDAAADAIDAIAEAFNARDLEALLEVVAADGEAPGLLGGDRDNLPDALEDLWARRPSACLGRGAVGDADVGVLWEHDGTTWWRLAVVHVDDVTDGRVGVLEFSDDTALLEQVQCEMPDDDLEEGATWAEWAEGADGGESADA
ncbi:hypothetical protein [Egicoccus sp. AB-alg6-2]|uniref:hypothetical protein n=1 Tax=Egicoccus sp. AB-alg6-2 TaxID=3242692 RepID=UPI00359E58F2